MPPHKQRHKGGSGRPPGAQAAGLRIVTHNVRGLLSRGGEKVTQLMRLWACELRAHIVCIQETHMTKHHQGQAERLLREAAQSLHVTGGYTAYWAPAPADGSNSAAGVGILVRSNMAHEIKLQRSIPKRQVGADGRALRLQLHWRGHHISLVNTYVPSGKSAAQRTFLTQQLGPALSRLPSRSAKVVCGDFNFTENRSLDRRKTGVAAQSGRDPATAAWQPLAQTHALSDAYRTLCPQRVEYTFCRENGTRSRIDRFYVNDKILRYVESCKAQGHTAGLTDHRPVVLHLRPAAPSTKGPGLPRLRLGPLSDAEGKEQVREVVARLLIQAPAAGAEAVGNATAQLLEWWPHFKAQLFNELQQLSRARAAQVGAKSGDRSAAEADLEAAEQQLARTPSHHPNSVAAVARAAEAAQRFAKVLNAEARAHYRAQRWQWMHSGERPSPLLSALLSPPASAGQIGSLKDQHGGGLIMNGHALAEETVGFFSRISAAQPTDPAAVTQVVAAVRAHAHRIPAETAQKAGAPEVTVEEVLAALKSTKPGTSPGPDGIPSELWRWCKLQLAPTLAALFTAMGRTGCKPPGFTEGAVSAIYKGKGDAALLSNYRPITLLNSDYRLLAKCLATRWGPALGAAIGKEQTAFLPGRQIGESVLFLQLLPEALRARGSRGAVAFLDFQKAYDTVSREFLLSVMDTVGAGGGMASWTRLLLSDTEAVAVVNGHVSTHRLWEAGVRQGCPLAPAMYLFVAWALSCWLRERGLGLQVGEQRVPCAQYADDTSALLEGWEEQHVEPLVAAMRVFAAASGQHLNLGKCKLMPVGRVPDDVQLPETVCGMSLVRHAVTLGIPFANTAPEAAAAAAEEWEQLVEGVLSCYDKLARLYQSAFGRAMSAAGYGISRLLYHAEHMDMPPDTLERLMRATVKLVDRGQAPKAKGRALPGIRSDLLAGPPSAGGMGMLAWLENTTGKRAMRGKWLLEQLAAVPLHGTAPPGSSPCVAAATVVLRKEYGPENHPAFCLLAASKQLPAEQRDQGRPINSAPLRRITDALRALGPWEVTCPASLPPAGWCMHTPIWLHPLLQLERPGADRPPPFQRLLSQQQLLVQAEDSQLLHHDLHGFSCLKPIPQLATLGSVLAVWSRLKRFVLACCPDRPLPAVACLQLPNGQSVIASREQWLRCVVHGAPVETAPAQRVTEVEYYAYSTPTHLLCMVEALIACLPAAWVQQTNWQPDCQQRFTYAECAPLQRKAVILALRSIGWPAGEFTSLPKALACPVQRRQLESQAASDPTVWVPPTFKTSPHLQLFHEPLRLSVKYATCLQRGPWRAAVAEQRMRIIKAALQLSAAEVASEGQAAGAPQVLLPHADQLLLQLGLRTKTAWKLCWENRYKETLWRLWLDGVPGAGGHGVALRNQPCPCGWQIPDELDASAAAAAQREHVLWHCTPARAVRAALQHNLPAGTRLLPVHLWLLHPPTADMHEGVWMVAGMAALTALSKARERMWAMHQSRQKALAQQRAAAAQDDGMRQLTIPEALARAQGQPAPAAAAADGAQPPRPQPQQQGRARRNTRFQRAAGAEQQLPVPEYAASEAVKELWRALRGFIALGRVPKGWEGAVTEQHPIIGAHVDADTGRARRLVLRFSSPDMQ